MMVPCVMVDCTASELGCAAVCRDGYDRLGYDKDGFGR